jgi:mono/diheme cytochrome c family protein
MSEKDIPSSSGHAAGHEDPPPDAPAEMPVPRLPRPPFWMIAIGIVAVVASWMPLALSARGRSAKSSEPRISLVQDMGIQPKLREQQLDTIFADNRAMRPGVAGTVARGDVEADDHYYRGFHLVADPKGVVAGPNGEKYTAVFYDGFPDEVKEDGHLTIALLQRGQQRFNIYCYACHGVDGHGHGPISQDALELMEAGVSGMAWVQPADLHSPVVRGRKEGDLFNTITNGVRNMPPYGNQIPVADRWAIVAYVKTLEFSQNAPFSALTPEQQAKLSGQ